ncbi:MAG: sugar phosphate isomerase/epimerase [Clostridia bacterium]|nr:sugar phosphate isomerase/epimerase [Clostridia bacterium]
MLKIGVQSSRWYDKNDPLESLKFIKECGFEAIDFNIDTEISIKKLAESGIYPTIFDKSIEELRDYYAPLKQALEATGVVISQMHAPFPTLFEGNDELNEYINLVLDKCFAVCEYLGCPAIVVHPLVSTASRSEQLNANIEYYKTLIPLIKKYKGVKICSENIFTRFNGRVVGGRFSVVDDTCILIDTLNSEAGGDYFGFCLDIGHAILTKSNINEYIKTLGHRLTVLHIHDNNGLEDQHLIPYSCISTGSGTVCDWEGFIDGLKSIGYDGALSFETFRSFKILPKSVMPSALRMIAAIGREWINQLTAE